MAAVLALLAGCASGGKPAPSVPDSLRAPANQSVALALDATGVQIYTCGPDQDAPAKFVWIFKAPDAELFDDRRNKVGKHYAGPTWEGNDGSKVVGQVRAQDPGPDTGAIAWLLLGAKMTSGSGMFGHIVSIQRVKTVGGKAPAGGCTGAQAGQEARVPYTATYYFYVATSASSM
jgi:hypothetical protein